VYAFILDVPREKLAIQSLSGKSGNGKIENIVLLGSNEKVTWSQTQDALTIQPSKSYPSQSAVGYKILFKK
jgi:alpha-L-fucosidase